LGFRDDICFDRFSRYGPYGLDYKQRGSGVRIVRESEGNEHVWVRFRHFDYAALSWSDAQECCLEANKHRFRTSTADKEKTDSMKGKQSRIAVIVRVYTGFKWTMLSIINMRALVTELSLKSGGEYNKYYPNLTPCGDR
jgi:hypothetical protein